MTRDSETTYRIMSSIHSKDTTPELVLRKALFARGYRYRVNYKKVTGKPDIAFTRIKLAIFIDGDFWHGHNWVIRGYGSLEEELSRYSSYWKDKILRNIARDEKVNAILQDQGWVVMRFWESDLRKNLDECLASIEHQYKVLSEAL